MSELVFSALGARVERFATAPTLLFRIAVEAKPGAEIHALALRCQLRIEPQRRRYAPGEAASLAELFGEPERWTQTLRPFLFTHVATLLPGFRDRCEFDLPVPCSYDFEVTAAKYFQALASGEIPFVLLFSGTVFARRGGGLAVTQVSWDCESRLRVPVSLWRELMDHYFPNAGWLRLRRETLDALLRAKAERAVASFDELVVSLLDRPEDAP